MSLELAQRLDAEIVALDSMQVYRHMDAGTAKPEAALRARVAELEAEVSRQRDALAGRVQ